VNKNPGERKWGGFRREIARGLGVVGLLLLIMFWLSGAFLEKVNPSAVRPKPEPPRMITQKVERRTFPRIIEQAGTIRAKTEARVSARVMAQVKEVLVKEGDMVVGSDVKGRVPTIMARLEDRDIQARLRQAPAQVVAMDRSLESAKARLGSAKAQVEAARANQEKVAVDYKRFQDLKRNAAATGQQLDHARAQRDVTQAQTLAAQQDAQAALAEIARIQAQREQAEAAGAEARAMLNYTSIGAPFTGRVIGKMVSVGDMASPGQTLFLVETPSLPEFHSALSESLVPYLNEGEDVDVHVDTLDRTLRGKVREISPMADPGTRTILVKVSLSSDPALLNGLYGRLEVTCGQYESLVVPSKSLRRVGQLDLVDAIGPDGHPLRRFVSVGRRWGDLTEILSGLRENEEVVVP
jgi:HlyD family secretion protein